MYSHRLNVEPSYRIYKSSIESTHPYRVWLNLLPSVSSQDCFNPHTHTGCDSDYSVPIVRYGCFNPHTHTGCDPPSHIARKKAQRFQSTHPYRVWLATVGTAGSHLLFQSTHPYRVWRLIGIGKRYMIKFQSTHPYRVWQIVSFSFVSNQLFQSTHPYRVWPHPPLASGRYHLFQSTHPYRVWPRTL